MKILQYNVFEGCRTAERYKMLCDWLISENYDAVGFNEMNNWKKDEFQLEMEKIGYSYSYLFVMESSSYHIGIASKFPIEVISSTEAQPFHHGMFHVKMNGMHIIVTHFCPFESVKRELEAGYIANYIQDINEPLIVMGDLNTLSPLDQAYYQQEDILQKIKTRERTALQHIRKGAINYKPMEVLLEAGLHDVNKSEIIDYSMPAQMNGVHENPLYARIDYALVNAAMLSKQVTAKIIRNREVAKISDHYPVECEIKQ
jgi:exonuclease III